MQFSLDKESQLRAEKLAGVISDNIEIPSGFELHPKAGVILALSYAYNNLDALISAVASDRDIIAPAYKKIALRRVSEDKAGVGLNLS